MLKAQLQQDLKAAMKAGHTAERDALRLMLADIQAAEKAEGKELSGEDELTVVSRLLKRTTTSLEEYAKLGQTDTVAKLEGELAVYKRYAPAQLTEAEVAAIVRQAIADSGAAGPQDMGKVMKLVMPQTKGKADGAMVNRVVKEALG